MVRVKVTLLLDRFRCRQELELNYSFPDNFGPGIDGGNDPTYRPPLTEPNDSDYESDPGAENMSINPAASSPVHESNILPSRTRSGAQNRPRDQNSDPSNSSDSAHAVSNYPHFPNTEASDIAAYVSSVSFAPTMLPLPSVSTSGTADTRSINEFTSPISVESSKQRSLKAIRRLITQLNRVYASIDTISDDIDSTIQRRRELTVEIRNLVGGNTIVHDAPARITVRQTELNREIDDERRLSAALQDEWTKADRLETEIRNIRKKSRTKESSSPAPAQAPLAQPTSEWESHFQAGDYAADDYTPSAHSTPHRSTHVAPPVINLAAHPSSTYAPPQGNANTSQTYAPALGQQASTGTVQSTRRGVNAPGGNPDDDDDDDDDDYGDKGHTPDPLPKTSKRPLNDRRPIVDLNRTINAASAGLVNQMVVLQQPIVATVILPGSITHNRHTISYMGKDQKHLLDILKPEKLHKNQIETHAVVTWLSRLDKYILAATDPALLHDKSQYYVRLEMTKGFCDPHFHSTIDNYQTKIGTWDSFLASFYNVYGDRNYPRDCHQWLSSPYQAHLDITSYVHWRTNV